MDMPARRFAMRPLRKTPYQVAPLGLSGSFGIDADTVERAFHEYGINYFFVTSRSKGLVEGIRRLVRDGHRDQIVIASGANIPIGARIEPAFRADCETLGVERIDVWHLFWVQYHWYVTGNTWPAMRKLKEQGRVGALAISCHDRPMATALVRELDLDVLMIRYNAAHRGAEREIFEPLGEERPGIVAYTATRWRKLLQPTRGFEQGLAAHECYRFVIDNPSVDVVLCGASSAEELRANAEGVLAGPLTAERREHVLRFGDAVHGSAGGVFGR